MDNDLWMMLSHLPDSGETVITCDKNPSQFQFLVRRGSQTLDRCGLPILHLFLEQELPTLQFLSSTYNHTYAGDGMEYNQSRQVL